MGAWRLTWCGAGAYGLSGRGRCGSGAVILTSGEGDDAAG